MSKRALNKIAAGLREALAIARGEKKPARVTTYSICAGCGNVTKTITVFRCHDCGSPKQPPPTQGGIG